MTSLMPGSSTRSTRTTGGTPTLGDLRHRAPVTLAATLGGALAAAGPLLVCLALGVIGWFLADAGSHGTPSDGLRTGALAWLMAHGSGVHVGGVLVTAVPLAVTAMAAWSTWRVGLRVGDAVSGHGPDADAITDGERDWTVPMAALLFGAGYLLVGVVTCTLASTAATAPAMGGVVAWSVGLVLLVGLPALAVGSGRAAIWASLLPATLVESARVGRSILRGWLVLSTVVLLGALVVDLGTAANVLSQLHARAGDTVVMLLVSLALLPNAVGFSAAYLAGPGFTVGAGTLVSPATVVLGPLPLFPMLAALPDAGTPPAWTGGVVVLAPLVAALLTARVQRRHPTLRWDEGALRGCVGGAVAAVGVTVLCALAGGAVGPGRMRDVSPLVGDVLVHSLTSFALGGLLGGLAMTAWQRRSATHRSDD